MMHVMVAIIWCRYNHPMSLSYLADGQVVLAITVCQVTWSPQRTLVSSA